MVEGLLYANARRFTKSAQPPVFRRVFRKNGNRMRGDWSYCFNRTRAFIGAQSLPGIGASDNAGRSPAPSCDRTRRFVHTRTNSSIALFVAQLHGFARILITVRTGLPRLPSAGMAQVKASANGSRKIRGIEPPNYGNRTA